MDSGKTQCSIPDLAQEPAREVRFRLTRVIELAILPAHTSSRGEAMRPTGTVTLLFSDIEGSTALLRTIGVQRYENALQQHRLLLRDAFARHAGYEVNTEGDSFFVAFGRALDAIHAAVDGQCALAAFAWPDGERIRVRMGIHTCEASEEGSDYAGMGVHRAARITATGHGEQILLSQTTHDLIEDEFGISCRDLGTHALKDFALPQRLYQLFDPRLPQAFPPLRALRHAATNFALPATALLGREPELEALRTLATRPDVRLITLTGAGGTGKTRLALQAAAELSALFESGAYLVMLQAIRDPALLLPTIGQTLGVSQAAGQSLSAYLASKELLLVLDNLEQIVDAANTLSELLAQSPRVRMIVTSREPLHITAERVFPVQPLALPEPGRSLDLTEVSAYAAVRLFVERAQAVQPSFDLTGQNAAHIAELCRRLDGLPLAIELAAARVPLLPPDAMLKRLGDRLKLLTTGARDAPRRQQTLRNTLVWSHELLHSDERSLFARLAVFAGGFSLEAAEAVCDAEIDTLAALVDRNMVIRHGERFRLLETVRDFALEQLASSADRDEVLDRHARYFEALAERAYAERWDKDKEGLDELQREHDNLRAALDYVQARDARRALRLAGALGWFWHLRSHFSEGRARLAQALAKVSDPDETRARALAAAAEIAAWAGDLANARALSEQAVALWREHGRTAEIGSAMIELGWGCFFAGDADARKFMQDGFDLLQSVGQPLLLNRARIGLLQVLVGIGELDAVEPLSREALAVAQRTRDLRSEHFAHHFLADCPLIRGDCAIALPRYQRALGLAVEIGDRAETAIEIQGVAMALAGCGQNARALRLAGAAAAEFDSLAIDVSGIIFWNDLLRRYIGHARVQLGDQEADTAWEEGRRVGFEYAIALASSAKPE
jgi:predicted ATPase/class 3 adenylate cyclase